MANFFSARERRWNVIYDTMGLHPDSVPSHVPSFSSLMTEHRFFGTGHMHLHYQNVCHGTVPADRLFRVYGLGLRANLKGPAAGDMLRMLLQSAKLALHVGDREIVTVPPGALVPPGLGVDALRLTHAVPVGETNDFVCDDFDEQGSTWANARIVEGDPLCAYYFPSAAGWPVGSRKVLDIQLELYDGEVVVEESNDDHEACGAGGWPPVYVDDLTNGMRRNRVLACTRDHVKTVKLRHTSTAERVRLRWVPSGIGATIKANVITCNAMLFSPSFASPDPPPLEVLPEALSGSFCRVMPVRPGITLPSFQNFNVLLSLDGSDLPQLRQAHEEGLLRGELSVLMPGIELRTIQ